MPVLLVEGIVPAAEQVAAVHTVAAVAHTAAVVVVYTDVAVAVYTVVAVVPAAQPVVLPRIRIRDRIRLHRLTVHHNFYKILPLCFPPK